MEGLAIPLRGEVLTSGGVHRRRSARHGFTIGTAGPAIRGDQIPESDDIAEAETPAAAQDFQATGEELPASKSDEHKRRDLGQTA